MILSWRSLNYWNKMDFRFMQYEFSHTSTSIENEILLNHIVNQNVNLVHDYILSEVETMLFRHREQKSDGYPFCVSYSTHTLIPHMQCWTILHRGRGSVLCSDLCLSVCCRKCVWIMIWEFTLKNVKSTLKHCVACEYFIYPRHGQIQGKNRSLTHTHIIAYLVRVWFSIQFTHIFPR